MPASYTVEGEAETIKALETATAVASDPKTLGEAAALVLPAVRMLGPNDSGLLAASYTLVEGTPPGISSPLVHAGIVEYGWPARGRPAYLRVAAGWAQELGSVEALILDRVESKGHELGL